MMVVVGSEYSDRAMDVEVCLKGREEDEHEVNRVRL